MRTCFNTIRWYLIQMGNLQQQCRGMTKNLLELDRHEAVYLPNDIISGTVFLYNEKLHASVLLTGIIYFNRRKRKQCEKYQIKFFST